MELDPAIFAFDLQERQQKTIFVLGFSAYYFLEVNLHHFSKIKSHEKSHKTGGTKVFLTIFA
jgi:hypothetical protein